MRRRHLLAWLGAASLPVHPAPDQLSMPSLQSARAAQALMLAVAFAGSRLVAAGERGIVVTSDDLGRTWHQAVVPVSVTLTALTFPTAQVGFATGHDGVVLRSRDAGRSWIRIFDGAQANERIRVAAGKRLDKARAAGDAKALKDAELAVEDAAAAASAGPARPLLGLWFADESNGWIVGSYGQMFRTSDGGATWALPDELPLNPDNLHYNHIVSPAPGTLIVAGEAGRVYRTLDDGKRWERLDTGYKGQLYGVLPLSDALLAFGFGGHVFRRSHGSSDWASVATTTRKSLVGGVRLADGRIVLASQDGGVEISADGGRSFRYMPGPVPLPLAATTTTPDGLRVIVAGFGGARVFQVAAASSSVSRPASPVPVAGDWESQRVRHAAPARLPFPRGRV